MEKRPLRNGCNAIHSMRGFNAMSDEKEPLAYFFSMFTSSKGSTALLSIGIVNISTNNRPV